jgi:hypothetical protein
MLSDQRGLHCLHVLGESGAQRACERGADQEGAEASHAG